MAKLWVWMQKWVGVNPSQSRTSKAQFISIETKRYSEFFRRVLAEYAQDVCIEIDGKRHGSDHIPQVLKEWCTNREICRTRDFKLLRGKEVLFGFHDHPSELFAAMSERPFVERLEAEHILRYRH